MITTVGEKLVRTKAEWNHFLKKLHEAGCIWCDGDSLLTEYEPEADFPLFLRMLSNNRVYWTEVDEPAKSFDWELYDYR